MGYRCVRWIIVVLMLAALTLGLSYPSIVGAESLSSLPLDYTQGGYPTKDDLWVYDGKTPVSYTDSSISVSAVKGSLTHSVKGKKVKHETWTVRIKISDPSQLRTAVSQDSYKGRGQAKADEIARSKNAVVALNGDFFKYENDVGYVIRQGEFIRDATSNKRKRIFDMLIIDSSGDFHVVYKATTDAIDSYIEENITSKGRTVFNTLNLGPVLVVDGTAQDVSASEAANQGCYQWKYPQQRIALVQTGTLEYAIVEVYGKTDSSAGLTMQDFADYVAEQCPDAIIAYNLDGGGSTNLIMKNKRICKTPGLREITDIIYFASAEE
jgi:exopolysaccharide biosynthesis protein